MNIENHDNVCQEEVFSFLFNAHSKAIFRSIFYKYGNEEKAYDVVQEAFVKLWEHCTKVTPEKAKSYVYTIANNNYLNVLKAEKVRMKYNNSGLEKDRTQESPEYLLEEKEFQQKLDNALNNLPENQRQTFLMNRVEGKKYAEIADLEGVSVKAIEKRMHLALKTLRETIDGI
ncbi:sigma-70 family RNA polymerase sigma factor [Zeaxanthinibacter sp. PT1]|uniref:RNA polymerase sigma factor n=1 Tax=Zeaxanthinibacter TaxID=561554 RepID=UPI00234BA971|nr:sigma-70 family RNA polymerase sigma factor [Zeaxanthinibacter sp. PT1]MDC6352589.1 sigma-70 family RNA polymerase sigma factor [Zeaxanthinibacter sp. PT1]